LVDEQDRRTVKDRRRVPRGGRRQADQITVQALQRQLEALRLELRVLIAEVKELKHKTD
jgi:fructose-1,6-bisphosphatase/sedoheptulose 1,7-bisphosphatase-like protein